MDTNVWKRPAVGEVSEWCERHSAEDILEEWQAILRDYRDAQEKRREILSWMRESLNAAIEENRSNAATEEQS